MFTTLFSMSFIAIFPGERIEPDADTGSISKVFEEEARLVLANSILFLLGKRPNKCLNTVGLG